MVKSKVANLFSSNAYFTSSGRSEARSSRLVVGDSKYTRNWCALPMKPLASFHPVGAYNNVKSHRPGRYRDAGSADDKVLLRRQEVEGLRPLFDAPSGIRLYGRRRRDRNRPRNYGAPPGNRENPTRCAGIHMVAARLTLRPRSEYQSRNPAATGLAGFRLSESTVPDQSVPHCVARIARAEACWTPKRVG